MECEAIRPRIRTFLDDLLDEKDYQEIHSHLLNCARCHSYASSVGTLSYRLYELGQVSAPPDMVSAVLYEYDKQNRAAPPEPSLKTEESNKIHTEDKSIQKLFWIAVCLVFTMSIIAAATIFGVRQVQNPEVAPLSVSAKAPSNESLNMNLTTSSPPSFFLTKESYPHWHYHVSKSSQSEFHDFFQQKRILPVDESAAFVMFDVPKENLPAFVNFMTSLPGVVKEFGEINLNNVKDDKIRVSVFFE